MLRPEIGEIRIQYDLLKALLKEPRDQHTEYDSTQATILAISFADFDADFRNTFAYFSIAGFTDQPLTFFQNQTAIAQPGDLVFYSDDSHVGIVGGTDADGNMLIIHCSGGANGVVITGSAGFTAVARPVSWSE